MSEHLVLFLGLVVVGFLVVWAGWSATELYRRTESLISVLARARSAVQNPEFLSNFEAAAKQLAALPLLGAAWSTYYDTLVINADPPTRPIRSTLKPDRVFELGLISAAGLNPRYHAAMPGMLVGAGLLFTFLGLAYALGGAGDVVAGADNLQRQKGLHQLLNAASFKFITSIAGLALSIFYTWFRNYRLRLVEQTLDGLNAALERQMPLATPAFLQHEANQTLQRQSAALEVFGTQLAVSIGEKLDSAFDQRLGEHIGPLTEAIRTLASRTSADNQDAVRQMMQAIIEQLSGGTRDHLAGVADILSSLGTRLEGLQTGLGDASAQMAQSAEAMAARMGEGAETALTRITDQISGLMETLRAVTAQTREAGAEAAQILARQSGALAETAEKLAARIGELDRATKEAVAPFAAGAADLCRTAEAAQAATTRLVPVGSSLGAAAEQIGRAAQRFDAAQAGAAKLSQEVAAAAQRFEGVDRSLAATLSALGSALDGFRQRIQDFVTNTDQNLAKAATNVAAMIRQLEAALEEHSSTRH
jgi:hypothetical protein